MPVSAELVMGKTPDSIRYSDHLGLQTVFACNAAPQRKRLVQWPNFTVSKYQTPAKHACLECSELLDDLRRVDL